MADDDRPRDPDDRPPRTDRIRIVGAESASEAAGRGEPEEGAPGRPRTDDPNRFGAIPIISPDDPPPAELSGDEPGGAPPDDDDDLPSTRPIDIAPEQAEESQQAPPEPAAPASPPPPPPPEEDELPSWTARLAEDDVDDDLDAWADLSPPSASWAGKDDPPDDFSDLVAGDDETDIGAAPPEPGAPRPPTVTIEDTDSPPPGADMPSAAGPPQREADPYPPSREEPGDPYPPQRGQPVETGGGGGPRDMQQAVVVGVGFAVLFFICAFLGPAFLVILAAGVVVLATAEFFNAVRRAGYHPAPLVGIVGSGCMVLACYWKGEVAFPLVTFLVVTTALLWWLLEMGGERAVANIGITVLPVLYIGGFGAFAALLLRDPVGNGVGLLFGAVLVTVAADVGGLFVGQQMGRTRFSDASPNKTVEGLVGGAAAAVIVAVVVLGVIGVHPWDIGDAFLLGLVAAIVAPVGDLCESMLKRDLGVKDMSGVLPGHGGFLDRFDGLLFVLPATYYIVALLETWANAP